MPLARFLLSLPALALLCVWPALVLAQDAQALLEQFNSAYTAAVAADEGGDLQAALPQWQQAFEAIDQFEESEEIVPYKEQVLFKLGETHRLVGREAESVKGRQEHYAEAERIFQTLLDRAVLAVYERDDILMQQGYLFSDRGRRQAEQGQFANALQEQEKAVQSFLEVSDEARRNDALARERSAIAKTYKYLGRYQEALQAAGEAMQFWSDTSNAEELRRERNAVATIMLNQGLIDEAAQILEQLIEQTPEATDITQASAAYNLGICLQLLGEYQRSLQYLQAARTMAKELGDPAFQLEIVNSQGILDYYLGLFQEALVKFDTAGESADNILKAKALLNSVAVSIASLQEEFDDALFQQAALDATESMAIAQTMDDPRTSLAATQNMGRLQFELASAPDAARDAQGAPIGAKRRVEAYASSLEHLSRALGTAEQLQAQSAGLYEFSDIAGNIGAVLLRLSDAGLNGQVNSSGLCPDGPLLQCSQAHYRLALENAKKIQAMEQVWRAHLGLGRVQRKLGDRQQAVAQFKAAIEVIESMRGMLGGTEAASFLRNRSEPYTELIDLRLEQWSQAPPQSQEAREHAVEALEYLERSRLSALKGLFEQALPQEKQQLGRELVAVEYRLSRLRQAGGDDPTAVAELERRQEELLQGVQEGDRLLQKPQLDLAAVQQAMPSDMAALVWYYDDKDIFVWKVTGEGVGLYRASRKIGSGRRARDMVEEYIPLYAERIASGDVGNLLVEFYKKLFGDTHLDLEPQVHSSLAVVPFGALSSLPFGAFITDKDENRYLLQDFDVQYLYAVSQLSMERKQEKSSLFAVGNPALPGYFGREVPLLAPGTLTTEAASQGKRGQGGEEQRAVPDLSVLPYEEAAFIYRMLNPEDYAPTVQRMEANRAFGFNPLPDAGEEVAAIGGDFEQRGLGASAAMVDSAVTERELLEQMQGAKRQYVHLATHGKLLPKSPLDSFLVFSEDPEAPEGYKSGLFTVRQIRRELFGDLAGTRLCTLSCCETALRGQGMGLELASLAAAFQSAGAAVVVASLWEVPSEATSMLMQRFYTHLFDGMIVSKALRKAQLELAASEKYAGPFYWAAFIPIGVDPHQEEVHEPADKELQEQPVQQETDKTRQMEQS